MKKLLLLTLAFVASLTAMAQTNLTSGKTVVPLGGLKSYNNGTTDYTISNDDLQRITTDGNTANVYLFPEGGYDTEANRTTGIQGFYIDLGASKSIGVIKSTWEGADCSADIYVTDTEPAADGTLTGATLIATFTNAQEAAKDVPVQVDNSGRYIVFVPGEATNYAWGVKIRTFAAFEKAASVLTSLEVSPSVIKVDEPTAMTFTAKDQVGIALTDGVTYTATGATLEGTTLTATAAGNVTITATYNGMSVSKTITAVSVSAPTANPTEPTDLAANVIAVYSAKYGKGLNENNPTWGVGGGAPNPFYNTLEEVEIADGHKVVHVTGTGFNNRTAGAVGITTDYDKIHVALYPFTATTAKIFGDNAYGSAITVNDLIPGQWNYVEVANPGNQPNYMLIELVDEQEFYLDHFYFSKPAVDDDEAPVLAAPVVKSVSAASVTLTLSATDNKSPKITYVVTDQNSKTYTTTGDNGAAIDFVISPLQSNTAYTFSVVAKDNNENATAAQTVSATTTALTAAPVPEKAAANVLSIYSDRYTPATTYSYGSWGQATNVATATVGDNEMLLLTNYDYLGFEYATDIDLKDMEYVHIDVLPLQNGNVGITPIMRGGTPTEKSTSIGTLTAGEWNSKDIKLSDLGLDYANYKSFQLKIDGGTGSDVLYVDNIYFWKEATTPEPVVHEGTEYTSGGHTIWVQGNHYLATNTYELIITSDEEMSGLGGSYWTLSTGNADLRDNIEISDDRKKITITAVSTSEPALYTPLYVLMPGEVNFSDITIDWVNIGEVELNVVVSGDVAAVTGPVTATDVETIENSAGTAAVINLVDATVNEAITITPKNKNAVVVVSGTGRTPAVNNVTVSNGNLVVYEEPYYRAAGVIKLEDDNNSQPAYSFVIDAQQDGVVYSRTIAAGKWVSFNSPASVTIPDGVDVYKATAATTGEITFTKQTSQSVGANEPVILHNTGSDVTVTSDNAKIDLNLTANGAGAEIGESTGVMQIGTSRYVEATGDEFALKDGELKQFTGEAKIGAFRVYFTGLTYGARAIFDDGETTTIGHIDANGNITVDGVYYDLSGRRVENPANGIFIHNGRKVYVK